jgi:3-oxoacyl-[acyl-carrier-protein] synthase II
MAGEVQGFESGVRLAGCRHVREMPRAAGFCLAAAREAVADAALDLTTDPDQVGVAIGSAAHFPTPDQLLAYAACCNGHGYDFPAHGFRGVRSEWYYQRLFQAASALVAINLGVYGPNYASAAACASGTQAIGLGARAIRRGEATAMICGGCDSVVTPLMLTGFCLLKALSRRNHDPAGACRPFDRGRDGIVLAEGAGVVVLEDWEQARRRGARIHAELAGYGTSTNAYRVTDVPQYGDGGILCMQRALADARVSPERVDLVNAHGTSTRQNDRAETAAIKAVFGSHARQLLVTANKSMLGDAIGGSGAIELIATALSCRDGIVPPTINYETPDPDCDLDYVPNQARHADVAVAIKNAFGFGGINTSLVVVRAPEERAGVMEGACAPR